MFASDLIWLLESQNFGTYGQTIFKGSKAIIPEGPGPFISISETGGAFGEGTHNDGPLAYRRPSAQLVFRAEDYDDAFDLAERVYVFLSTVRNQFVNGTWWRSVQLIQEPFDMQPDDQNRARIAFNIDVVKRS